MANKAAKGSDFEREICKQLSKWWTGGKRDDIYWRAIGSGGWATQRRQSGKDVNNNEGDIAATDPIGIPLLKVWSFELKRGYNDVDFLALLDKPSRKGSTLNSRPFVMNWAQTVKQCKKGAVPTLIFKRDRCQTMIAFNEDALITRSLTLARAWVGAENKVPVTSIHIPGTAVQDVVVIRFTDWLEVFTPELTKKA